MKIQDITGKVLRDGYRQLPVIRQIRIQSESTAQLIRDALAGVPISREEGGAVTRVTTALLYGVASMEECVSYLTEHGIATDRAQAICGGLSAKLIGESGEGRCAADSWYHALLMQLRGCGDAEGALNFLESLVGAVSSQNNAASAVFPAPDKDGMYGPGDVAQALRVLCANLPTPVVTTITTHKYREYCTAALHSVVDSEAQNNVVLEVLATLLGLQTMQEFEEYFQHFPSLSAEQGRDFVTAIHKSLFAELALYVDGMSGDNNSGPLHTLETAVASDSDVSARLSKLPASVQTMIRSMQLEDAFASIQRRHHIDSDMATFLGGQMVRVMVGLTAINDFKVNITRTAGIPPSSLDALFQDIEQRVFKPVRTAILGALENNMGSLPTQDSHESADPYRAAAH